MCALIYKYVRGFTNVCVDSWQTPGTEYFHFVHSFHSFIENKQRYSRLIAIRI